MAFLLHHITMLILPTVIGSVLFAYHVYLAYLNYDDDLDPITNYQKQIDTPWNLIYALFGIVWNSIYVESWKRK